MAISDGSSPTWTEVYESLFLICQATKQITHHLDRLQAANVLGRVSAEIKKSAALQLRAEITTAAVHNLAAPEIEEAHQRESKRIRLERKQAQARSGRRSRQK